MTTPKRISLIGTGTLMAALLIAACHQQEQAVVSASPKPVIRPPFKAVDVAYTTYTINPTRDDTIVTASGSRIMIPKGALIDSLGFPITEACLIHYREFMDPASVMASGIPMTFKNDPANLDKQFVTAGMFEIKGETVTRKKIRISNARPLSVELASNNTQAGFSSFYLDPKTGDWIYSGEELLAKNQRKVDLNRQIEKLKGTLAFSGKNYFILNSMAMLDVYLNADYAKIVPYYGNKHKKLPARLLKYGIRSSDLYCRSGVTFNKSQYAADYMVWENISGIAFPEWTKNNYARLKLIKGNVYELEVNNTKKQVFKAQIKAVMTIKHLFSFGPEYWTSNYDDAMRQIREDEARLATMKEVTRTLEVNRFGVYNADKFSKEPDAFFVEASFTFPGKANTMAPESIFYISRNEKSMITYSYGADMKLPLSNDSSAFLMTVLPGNLLAEVSSEQLTAVKAAPKAKVSHHFDFKVKAKVNSMEDIKKAIGI